MKIEEVSSSAAFLVPSLPSTKKVGGKNAKIKTVAGMPMFSTGVPTVNKTLFATNGAPKLYPTLVPQQSGNSGFGGAPAAGKREKMIVWFRADLRLHDHPALMKAVEHGSQVLPLFCFDPRQFGKASYGFAKTGRYRAEFLIEAVEQLRKRLRNINSDLIVREGRPEDVIVNLCREHGIKKVVYHREVCLEEQEVEQNLKRALERNRIEQDPLWSNTLYNVEDLPFSVEKMPDVYSQFRDLVSKRSKISEPMEAPKSLPTLVKCEAGRMPTLRDLGLDKEPAKRMKSERFTGGEIEAMARLDKYIKEARRSESTGTTSSYLGADFSCKISPWLALGCVSPRRIFKELQVQGVVPEANKSTTYFELVWRDFFRFITLKYGASRLRSGKKNVTRATSLSSKGFKQQQFNSSPAPALVH